MKKIQITDLILRDAHQSLIATRMRIEDMLPAAEALDNAGFFSLEMWGGATFDVCQRFLNENPWERLTRLKKVMPKTKFQMLLRGQNLVGYKHYADDVVDAFVERAYENGIEVFRIFDALNDIRNLKRAMNRASQIGAVVEGSISYTVSPVHTIEQFVHFAGQLKDEGAGIICIKDMAGMISPEGAYELTSALKSEVGLPVHLHTHCASGMAPATFLRAAQAGVDIVDCALSPFSWGTSHVPTETAAAIFSEGGYETGLDMACVYEAAHHFQKVRERYMPILNPRSERVDTNILVHQIPGGMLSNLLSQLELQGASDKFENVLEETARVRKDLGYPPLVTPTSQIVGTQAVFNVVAAERYDMISQEVKDYCRGMYGRSPARIDPDVQRKAIGDEKPIVCRPADLIQPELEEAIEAVKAYSDRLEDALSYAMFPRQALAFLQARAEGKAPATTEPPPEELTKKSAAVAVEKEGQKNYRLRLGNQEFCAAISAVSEGAGGRVVSVVLDGDETFDIAVSAVAARRGGASAESVLADDERKVSAPMPGMVVKVLVSEGDKVEAGAVVVLLEAMKMQNEIKCSIAGTVGRVAVKDGDNVDKGTLLVELSS